MIAVEEIRTPFSTGQVWSLNAFQDSGRFYPFTCADCGTPMTATVLGFVCRAKCGYYQTKTWSYAANWQWKDCTAEVAAYVRANG